MRVGDLVTGNYKKTSFGIEFIPLESALGIVVELEEERDIARVLYDNRIHSYFLSELRVVTEDPEAR